jgi:hypothetical protein
VLLRDREGTSSARPHKQTKPIRSFNALGEHNTQFMWKIFRAMNVKSFWETFRCRIQFYTSQPWWWWKQAPLKRRSVYTRPHDAILKMKDIFIGKVVVEFKPKYIKAYGGSGNKTRLSATLSKSGVHCTLWIRGCVGPRCRDTCRCYRKEKVRQMKPVNKTVPTIYKKMS